MLFYQYLAGNILFIFDIRTLHYELTSVGDDEFFQENNLSSLSGGGSFSDLSEIQVLDLHKNCLEKLSEDIGHLANVKVSIIF